MCISNTLIITNKGILIIFIIRLSRLRGNDIKVDARVL